MQRAVRQRARLERPAAPKGSPNLKVTRALVPRIATARRQAGRITATVRGKATHRHARDSQRDTAKPRGMAKARHTVTGQLLATRVAAATGVRAALGKAIANVTAAEAAVVPAARSGTMVVRDARSVARHQLAAPRRCEGNGGVIRRAQNTTTMALPQLQWSERHRRVGEHV